MWPRPGWSLCSICLVSVTGSRWACDLSQVSTFVGDVPEGRKTLLASAMSCKCSATYEVRKAIQGSIAKGWRWKRMHVCMHMRVHTHTHTHLQVLMTELLDLGKSGTSSSLDLPVIWANRVYVFVCISQFELSFYNLQSRALTNKLWKQ